MSEEGVDVVQVLGKELDGVLEEGAKDLGLRERGTLKPHSMSSFLGLRKSCQRVWTRLGHSFWVSST